MKSRATYSFDDFNYEVREPGVDVVGDDAYTLRFTSVKRILDVAGHVLLEHGFDFTPFSLV